MGFKGELCPFLVKDIKLLVFLKFYEIYYNMKENFNVNSVKIIGLPVAVLGRHRIFLDKNIRTLYQIQKDDSVLMHIEQGFLLINLYHQSAVADDGEKKNITIGRFNLPESWVKENRINVGDFVYLIATDTGIVICPKNIELLCIGGTI